METNENAPGEDAGEKILDELRGIRAAVERIADSMVQLSLDAAYEASARQGERAGRVAQNEYGPSRDSLVDIFERWKTDFPDRHAEAEKRRLEWTRSQSEPGAVS